MFWTALSGINNASVTIKIPLTGDDGGAAATRALEHETELHLLVLRLSAARLIPPLALAGGTQHDGVYQLIRQALLVPRSHVLPVLASSLQLARTRPDLLARTAAGADREIEADGASVDDISIEAHGESAAASSDVDRGQLSAWVAFPLAPHGTLMQLLLLVEESAAGRLPLEVARRCFVQVAQAVCECHTANVAHRDIKPENVLVRAFEYDVDALFAPGASSTAAPVTGIPTPRLDLGDFGLSVLHDDRTRRLNLHVGTLRYAAPELVSGRSVDPFAADVWALGVVLFVLAVGHFPFGGTYPEQTRAAILSGRQSFRWPALSAAALPPRSLFDLLGQMLSLDDCARPSIVEGEWSSERFVGMIVEQSL